MGGRISSPCGPTQTLIATLAATIAVGRSCTREGDARKCLKALGICENWRQLAKERGKLNS